MFNYTASTKSDTHWTHRTHRLKYGIQWCIHLLFASIRMAIFKMLIIDAWRQRRRRRKLLSRREKSVSCTKHQVAPTLEQCSTSIHLWIEFVFKFEFASPTHLFDVYSFLISWVFGWLRCFSAAAFHFVPLLQYTKTKSKTWFEHLYSFKRAFGAIAHTQIRTGCVREKEIGRHTYTHTVAQYF